MPWSEKRHCIATCDFSLFVYPHSAQNAPHSTGTGWSWAQCSLAPEDDSPMRETHTFATPRLPGTETPPPLQSQRNRPCTAVTPPENPHFEAHSKTGESRESYRGSQSIALRVKRPLHECPSHNERWCTNVASVTRRHGLLHTGIRARAAASRPSSSLLAFMSTSTQRLSTVWVLLRRCPAKKRPPKTPSSPTQRNR